MDLFPECQFRVLLAGGALQAGQRNLGTLELQLPEDVPRAEHVDLVFRSDAVAGYGSGKHRTVLVRTMVLQPLRIDIPPGGLRAGVHTFPFALDMPPWLPSAYVGSDCSIRHTIELRLDVDWAIDPKATLAPLVVPAPPPQPAVARPLARRSPGTLHEAIALEVQLDRDVVRQDEPITGEIALRTGHEVPFDAVVLSLIHVARVSMGRGDARDRLAVSLQIPAERLRGGESVRFRFDGGALPTTNRNNHLDLSSLLRVALDVSWWTLNRAFDLPIEVVSTRASVTDVEGAQRVALGEARMRIVANELAARTGLRAGETPVLVEGREGAVAFSLEDASRGGESAAAEVFTFPDLHLGARSRPLGVLPIGSSLAPAPLDQRFALKCATERVDQEALRAFFARALSNASGTEHLEVSDHRIALRRVGVDDPAWWLEAARAAQARAKEIAAAIAALPFADPSARAAWTAAASEESAHLVPHLPAISGVRRAVRTVGGDLRELSASVETRWDGDEATTRIDVDLDTPLPAHAIPSLLDPAPTDDLLRALRSAYAHLEAASPTHLVAIAQGFAADPRPALAALDTVLAWTLRARGERRADAPYR